MVIGLMGISRLLKMAVMADDLDVYQGETAGIMCRAKNKMRPLPIILGHY